MEVISIGGNDDVSDRERGSRSNKINICGNKIQKKKNTRDTNIRGSPDLGYVHKEICHSFLSIIQQDEGIQPTSHPL